MAALKHITGLNNMSLLDGSNNSLSLEFRVPLSKPVGLRFEFNAVNLKFRHLTHTEQCYQCPSLTNYLPYDPFSIHFVLQAVVFQVVFQQKLCTPFRYPHPSYLSVPTNATHFTTSEHLYKYKIHRSAKVSKFLAERK
jgi:hypothetical protein